MRNIYTGIGKVNLLKNITTVLENLA